jgi:hypothetical protein
VLLPRAALADRAIHASAKVALAYAVTLATQTRTARGAPVKLHAVRTRTERTALCRTALAAAFRELADAGYLTLQTDRAARHKGTLVVLDAKALAGPHARLEWATLALNRDPLLRLALAESEGFCASLIREGTTTTRPLDYRTQTLWGAAIGARRQTMCAVQRELEAMGALVVVAHHRKSVIRAHTQFADKRLALLPLPGRLGHGEAPSQPVRARRRARISAAAPADTNQPKKRTRTSHIAGQESAQIADTILPFRSPPLREKIGVRTPCTQDVPESATPYAMRQPRIASPAMQEATRRVMARALFGVREWDAFQADDTWTALSPDQQRVTIERMRATPDAQQRRELLLPPLPIADALPSLVG